MKLTLNKVWELCVEEWTWVIQQIKNGSKLSVGELKEIWGSIYGYKDFYYDCFFCAYSAGFPSSCDTILSCKKCPARKIDKNLNEFWCESQYEWNDRPEEFYKKILKLNRKRKKGKK